MQKHIKEIITAIIIAVITGAFAKINYLEKELTILKQFSTTANSDIKILKEQRERLSDYYVTRIEFNRVVKDLKEYNVEMKVDLNKRFDKLENIILNIK